MAGYPRMNIPASITSAGQVGRFSREVREALSALNRKIPPPVQARSMPKAVKDHPFRVVPEGDEHVTIKTGKVYVWEIINNNGTDALLNFPIYGRGVKMTEKNEVEVSGEGKIYLVIPANSETIISEPGEPVTNHVVLAGAINAIFSADEPAPATADGNGNIYLEIAEVDIEDGVAKVVDQILDENVWLSIQSTYKGS
jgi:hypothetical protein